jgi:hypothetical protein
VHAIKLRQFPKIKQKGTNWCIPAAVENVIRFHGGHILQEDILNYYIEKYHHIEDIDVEKVHDILEHHFGKDYSYRILSKRTSQIIRTVMDVISLIKSGIRHDLPPIVLVELPSCWYLPGYSTRCDHYVFTALGFSQNSVLIWDTNPNTLNIPVVVENDWVKKHISPDMKTFWVIPNEKLETFENFIKEDT